MLTVGFLVLLTIAVINANRLIVDKDSSYYEAEAYKQASILANSLITEIQTKKFDSRYDYPSPYTGMQPLNTFDGWNSMGPSNNAKNYVNPGGAADTYPYKSVRGDNGNYFDDVDDYNGYKRSASTATLSGFTLTVSVYYVYPSNTDIAAYTQTYTKRIDITVSNPKYLPKDLVFSAIAYYDY